MKFMWSGQVAATEGLATYEYGDLYIVMVMPHFREAQKLSAYLDAVQNKAVAEGKKLAHDKIANALKEIL